MWEDHSACDSVVQYDAGVCLVDDDTEGRTLVGLTHDKTTGPFVVDGDFALVVCHFTWFVNTDKVEMVGGRQNHLVDARSRVSGDVEMVDSWTDVRWLFFCGFDLSDEMWWEGHDVKIKRFIFITFHGDVCT